MLMLGCAGPRPKTIWRGEAGVTFIGLKSAPFCGASASPLPQHYRQHYPQPQHEDPQRGRGGSHRALSACLAGGDAWI